MKSADQLIEELFTEYSSLIYRFILLMINSKEEAEDLTQEVFIKAYKGYKRLYDQNISNSTNYAAQGKPASSASHWAIFTKGPTHFIWAAEVVGETKEDGKLYQSDGELLNLTISTNVQVVDGDIKIAE